MSFSESDRRRVAGRARTLHERLDRPAADGASVERVEEPLVAWREHVASGDADAFADRLAHEDLTESEARERVAGNGWPDGEPLPDWVDDVEALTDVVAGTDPAAVSVRERYVDAVPFVELFVVLAEHAVDRLDASLVEAALEPAALADLEAKLVHLLQRSAAHPLFVEFKTFVARHDRELALGDATAPVDDRRRYYDRFVADLFDGGFAEFLVEYAFLARVLATVVGNWVAAVESLCDRVLADRDAIATTFGDGSSVGRVESVRLLGDPHGGGEMTSRVTFADGPTVAYKPRDVGITAAYYEFLTWVNDRSSLPNLATLDVLERDGYGWVEWAPAADCESTAAVDRYYRRAGVMMAILYALRFADGHLENVVAAGEHPVLIDVETLAKPSLSVAQVRRPGRMAVDVVAPSVLGTGLVPEGQPTAADYAVSGDEFELSIGSGFGAAEGESTGMQYPTFTAVNTDDMELEYRDTQTWDGRNLPRVNGDVVEPDGHADAIRSGFEAAYRFLLDEQAALGGPDGALSLFEGREARLVYRSTAEYAAVLESVRTPPFLRTGVRFGAKAEALAAPLVDAAGFDQRAVYEAERRALLGLDVPRFSVRTDDRGLYGPDGDVVDASFLDRTPLADVRERVGALSEGDLVEQLDYMRLAYGGRRLPDADFGSTTTAGVREDDEWTEPLDVVVERHVRGVYDRLQSAAVRDERDDPVWYRRQGCRGGVYVDSLEDDAYAGRLGVGVFCAALARVYGETTFRESAREVVEPVLADVTASTRSALGVQGVGSVVYGLGAIGSLLDDDEVLDAGRRVASALSVDRLASDDAFDVLHGNAGLVLGLTALYDRTGDEVALDRAVVAGERLLEAAVEVGDGVAWPTGAGGQPLCGFAHGAAGISLSLARLAAATGEERFASIAREAIAFEDAQYDSSIENWPDRRSLGSSTATATWCSGRPGVGLARLGTYEALGDDAARAGVERALAGVDGSRVLGDDHLCCGNAGRVSLCWRGGRAMDDAEAVSNARSLARACMTRAECNGRFAGRWHTDAWFNPSLFGGAPGVGYVLSTLIDPSLPRIATWR